MKSVISSSKFDSNQIISDRHRPLNGRLSLSYDHISPQLRRRKFKPRERGRGEREPKNERGTPNRFSVSHTMKIRPFGFSVWERLLHHLHRKEILFLRRLPPSSRPPMPLQTINQGRNNAVRTVSYSAPPRSKKTQSCYARTATYTAGEVTIINPCTATRDGPKIAWNFSTYEIW